MTTRLWSLLTVATLTTHAQAADEAEILWDEWGVPHIFADSLPAATKGFGWFTAKNHGNMAMRMYGIARGRASEYWGAVFRPFDLSVHGQLHVQNSAALWEELDEFSQLICDVFAEGFNDYVQEHTDEFEEKWLQVLPISAMDVWSHAVRLLDSFAFAGARTGDELKVFLEEFSQVRTPDAESDDTVHHSWQIDYAADFEALIPEGYKDDYGSNTMAVNPDKGAGVTKLLINPHLPYYDAFKFTEAHLVVEGWGDAYGTTPVGLPSIIMGFTDHIGWAHTVNKIQGWTQYRVDLDPADTTGQHYLFDGDSMPIHTDTSTFFTKGLDGSLTEHTVVVEQTLHGIVYARSETQLLVAKLAGPERVVYAIPQYMHMLEAKNMDEFKEAMRELGLGFFTTCAASVDGDILNSFNGWVPDRTNLPEPYRSGDFDFWMKAQNGSTSDTLWTDVHAWDELPQETNPAVGYTQNANEPPWLMSLPTQVLPEDYPPYVSPNPYVRWRTLLSLQMLEETDTIDFDQMVEFQHNTRVEVAYHMLDDLLEICDRECNDEQKEAAEALRRWDRRFEADSKGGALFLEYLELAPDNKAYPGRDDYFAVPWSMDDLFNTPRGVREPQRVVEDLETAIRRLRRKGFEPDVEFGQVYRLPLNDTDDTLPGNGSRDTYRSTWWGTPIGNGQQIPYGGDTFVAIVEFVRDAQGRPRSRAKGLVSYGNASQGPHLWDQMYLYAEQELRELRKDYDDIMQHVQHIDRISVNVAKEHQ